MKYKWSTTLGCKNLGIRKSEFVQTLNFFDKIPGYKKESSRAGVYIHSSRHIYQYIRIIVLLYKLSTLQFIGINTLALISVAISVPDTVLKYISAFVLY